MNIAILGYGKMGHAIEQTALRRGHTIGCTIDKNDLWTAQEAALRQCDVAIEFSTPATAPLNVRRCLESSIPVVVGTTGWNDQLQDILAYRNAQQGYLFVASNFSVGMNIMFALNQRLADLMHGRKQYSVSIEETHHVHKLDSPSGTALTLASQIGAHVPIESHRIGEVPGTHTVRYVSEEDTISITHEAHSRIGFALGAVLAAEFLLQQKPGFYSMNDLLGL